MKKLVLVLGLGLMFVACDNTKEEKTPAPVAQEQVTEQQATEENKDTTEAVAEPATEEKIQESEVPATSENQI